MLQNSSVFGSRPLSGPVQVGDCDHLFGDHPCLHRPDCKHLDLGSLDLGAHVLDLLVAPDQFLDQPVPSHVYVSDCHGAIVPLPNLRQKGYTGSVTLHSYRPRDVLPDPSELDCMVAFDTETTDLFVDSGATVAVVSVALCRKETPDLIEGYAFAFDQGRAKDKGFEPSYYVKGGLRANRNLAEIMGWREGDEVPPGFFADPEHPKALMVDLPVWEAERGGPYDLNLPYEDWVWLMDWLVQAGKHVGLTGQNVKFDAHQVRNGTREFEGAEIEQYIAWDTMLASSRLWPLEPSGLKPTGSRLFGEAEVAEAQLLRLALIVNKKLWGLKADDGPRYDLLPHAINLPYAAQDAILTLRIAKLQTDLMEENWNPAVRWTHIQQQVDLTRVLYRIEKRGLGPLDVRRTERVAQALEARIAEIERQIREDAGINPVTIPQAKKYFFDTLGLRPWKGAEDRRVTTPITLKDGTPSLKVTTEGTLNLDVLKRLADQNVPWAAQFAELTRLKTANTMNYRGYLNLRGPDDRLRTNFRQAYVKSGRMSVERFQAQNIPRRDSVQLPPIPGLEHRGPMPHPRDLFLVQPGRKRITMDLAQAELRVAAVFSKCKLMTEQILAGRDLHSEMTTQVFDLTPGDDHPKKCDCSICSNFQSHRYIAKRCIFGSIFGIGPKTFKDDVWKNAGLEISYATAVQTVEGFHELYPEIPAELEYSQAFAEDHGYVELVDGSRSYFPPDRPWECRTAWSRRVQGSLAVFNADWLIATEAMTENLAPGGCMVLSVHDSISLDVPTELVDTVKSDCSDWVAKNFEKTFNIPGRADWDDW